MTSAGDTVHGNEIKEGQSRFFITKILKNARSWKQFSVDEMVVGSAIMWDMNSVKRVTKLIICEGGTEVVVPTVLPERKTKRNESEWQKNVKKRKLNSGEGYELVEKRTGKTVSREQVKLKPPCPPTCKKQCRLSFSDEERQVMLDNYLRSENITQKRLYLSKLVVVKPKQRT